LLALTIVCESAKNFKSNNMKKQMTTSKSRTNLYRLLLAGFLLTGTTSLVQAQENAASSSEPNVQYVGLVNNKYVFQVEFQNEAPDFILEIKDHQGYQLFADRFKSRRFKKQFVIDKANFSDNGITFIFTAQGKVQKQVFDINTTSRIVEEVSVVKLK
jgi:hypothetical protein